ncbi:hypothetical protein B0H13DRAFT_1880223 [Mycena leptocephala]|nr:hypothetical protein B0H13DRAFT_1880223 [Mycena leptocephala]
MAAEEWSITTLARLPKTGASQTKHNFLSSGYSHPSCTSSSSCSFYGAFFANCSGSIAQQWPWTHPPSHGDDNEIFSSWIKSMAERDSQSWPDPSLTASIHDTAFDSMALFSDTSASFLPDPALAFPATVPPQESRQLDTFPSSSTFTSNSPTPATLFPVSEPICSTGEHQIQDFTYQFHHSDFTSNGGVTLASALPFRDVDDFADLPSGIAGLAPDVSGHYPYELTAGEFKEALGSSVATSHWDWHDSDTVWLDPGVSSQVAYLPNQFSITTKCKVQRIERVTGLPSQFPISEIETAFVVDLTKTEHLDATMTVDSILKDHSIGRLNCKATLITGGNCKGQATMQRTEKRIRNKDYLLVCSDRNMPLAPDSAPHSVLGILDHIDQDILLKVMSGERITDSEEADNAGLCSRVISARTGQKGKALCQYTPYASKSPQNRLTQSVAELYRECVRKVGIGTTPLKVDKGWSNFYQSPSSVDVFEAATTIAILGTTPALFHAGLANRDVRFKLVQQVAAYVAQQQSLPTKDRYLESIFLRDGKTTIFGAHPELLKFIHRVRTLDCDTTFKPVAGEMQIFEINGWMPAINQGEHILYNERALDTYYRVAITLDQEIQRRLVKLLTARPIGFKAIHKNGTLMGLNADMEAAPVLGFGDAFLPTIDRDELLGNINDAETLLCYVLRICYTHIDRGIPLLPHLSREDHQRIRNFKYPSGELAGWWNHKLRHSWLLSGAIQCLSRMPPDDWHLMEATSNLGEAQHAWNNSQTGIGMGVIESF